MLTTVFRVTKHYFPSHHKGFLLLRNIKHAVSSAWKTGISDIYMICP